MLIQTYDTIRTMQLIQLAVSRGFHRWTGGVVRYDRAEKLAEKFTDIYGVNPDRAHDMRLRRAGAARSRLVFLPDSALLSFVWWLLVSEGAGPVVEGEQLRDATDRRNRIMLRDWELLRAPRRQTHEAVAWTWRLPEKEFQARLALACAVATHESAKQAQALIDAMRSWPGFHGIAQQRREIQDAMVGARRKVGRGDALALPPHPPWPRLLEMRRHGTSLPIAVERMRQQVRTGDTQ
ncbi:hypothetical protein GALL_231660 [mine drainage metagenome]|uniref:Uncharacterized protein n=1 Tax=mine drainage metagenome TaxID=410659 RepID=A0A1J5RZ68_9ZZZZ